MGFEELQFRTKRLSFGIRIGVVASLCLLSAACGRFSGTVRNVASDSVVDFMGTDIMDTGPTAADGVSDLTIVIRLRSTNGTPIVNFQPTYSVITGTSVTAGLCSLSNSSGQATCTLRSNAPGVKRIRLTNARTGLEHDVTFSTPHTGGQALGIVAGGVQKGTTSGGYKLQVSVGEPTQGIKMTTSGGYKANFSLQGALLPQSP